MRHLSTILLILLTVSASAQQHITAFQEYAIKACKVTSLWMWKTSSTSTACRKEPTFTPPTGSIPRLPVRNSLSPHEIYNRTKNNLLSAMCFLHLYLQTIKKI